jgi:hypothetical protein
LLKAQITNAALAHNAALELLCCQLRLTWF